MAILSVISEYKDNGFREGIKAGITTPLKEVAKVTNQATVAIKKVEKQQENVITTVYNAKKQYAQMKRQIQDLTVTYEGLTKAQKQSAEGKALEQKLEGLKDKASQFLDTIGDVNDELKHLASDTKFTDSLGAYTKMFGSVASIATVAAGNSQHFKEVIMDLAKIQTVVSSVNALTEALQKQNRVLLKNPYAMAIAAIAALTYALYKAKDATYKYRDAIDAADASTSDFANNSLPSLIRQLKNKAEVELLTSEFNDLQDQLEENEKAQERLLNPQKFSWFNIKQSMQHWKDYGNTIEDLQGKHSDLKKQQQAVFTKLHELTEESTTTTKKHTKTVTEHTTSVTNYNNELKALYKSLEDVKKVSDEIMAQSQNLWKDAYKNLAKDAMAGKASAPIGITAIVEEVDDDNTKSFTDRIEKLGKEAKEAFEKGLKDGKSPLASLIDAENLENGLKKIDALKKKLSGVAGAANTASAMFNSLGSAMQSPVFNVLGTIAQAVANIALAYSDAFAKDQGTKSNIFAFIASVAAGVVSMVTTISAVKKAATYASGGIVGSTVGDYNIARVNGGEMILNGRQQENLFKILQGRDSIHGSNADRGQVEFKLRGDELVGVIKNYGRKMSKIR